jgi:hypothetical protein
MRLDGVLNQISRFARSRSPSTIFPIRPRCLLLPVECSEAGARNALSDAGVVALETRGALLGLTAFIPQCHRSRNTVTVNAWTTGTATEPMWLGISSDPSARLAQGPDPVRDLRADIAKAQNRARRGEC